MIPRLAISVRQPWAWAIIHGGKDVENRSQAALRHMSMPIGERIAIHASRGITRGEYEDAADFMRQIGVICPPPAELLRGGVIGSVEIVAVVRESQSPWFMGPRGIVLRDPQPFPFTPAKGLLGLFKWAEGGEAPAPFAWMIKQAAVAVSPPTDIDLFSESR